MVADVYRGTIASQHLALGDAKDLAGHQIDMQAEMRQLLLRKARQLRRHDEDSPAVFTYGRQRLCCPGQCNGAGERRLGVDRPKQLNHGWNLFGWEPALSLHSKWRPQSPYSSDTVNIDARSRRDLIPGCLDARPAIDERHVEIEAHDEWDIPLTMDSHY